MSFREALLKGLAPDRGLYMPESIPSVNNEFLTSLRNLTYSETAFRIMRVLLAGDIPDNDLESICSDAYDFDVPLEQVYQRKYILRLDRGPTASFKDFAARLMARMMNYFIAGEDRHYTILTATSGDTGSAVAGAFHSLSNINVIILYPAHEVSDIQRRQMTTLHDNIRVLAVNGKFDDCQRLVKQAFGDRGLDALNLTSANSINIGRLLPQAVYYFHAWAKTSHDADDKIIFSVPSGNFGNLMGGLIARSMGLPVRRFIISTNENNEVPEFLRTGNYKPIIPSLNCISSAMNVGHPGNLARIFALYGGVMDESGTVVMQPDTERMRKDFFGSAISDEQTRMTMKSVYQKYSVILEPHGAVAWRGIENFLSCNENNENQLFVSLETAHPAKFREEIKNTLGIDLPYPGSLRNIDSKKEYIIEMVNDYHKLRSYLISSNNQ